MHTPGRLGCGPADGEARATPAPMSVPTCCLLVGLALWASSPCGPGLWACCPPFRSSGVEAGFSFQIPHAWPQRQAEPCRGCPTPTSWRPSRNRMAWYPGLKHSSSVRQQYHPRLGSGMGLEWASTMTGEKPRTPRSEVSVAALVYMQGQKLGRKDVTLFCTPAPTPPNRGP